MTNKSNNKETIMKAYKVFQEEDGMLLGGAFFGEGDGNGFKVGETYVYDLEMDNGTSGFSCCPSLIGIVKYFNSDGECDFPYCREQSQDPLHVYEIEFDMQDIVGDEVYDTEMVVRKMTITRKVMDMDGETYLRTMIEGTLLGVIKWEDGIWNTDTRDPETRTFFAKLREIDHLDWGEGLDEEEWKEELDDEELDDDAWDEE